MEALLVALHICCQIQLQVSFGFLNCNNAYLNSLYIPPILPVPAFTFCILLFYIWVSPGTLCSSVQASLHFCLTSWLLRWTALELGGDDLQISTNFLGQVRSGASVLCSGESSTTISCHFLLVLLCGSGSVGPDDLHQSTPSYSSALRAVNLFSSCKCSGAAGAFLFVPGGTLFQSLPCSMFSIAIPLGTWSIRNTVWCQAHNFLPYLGLLRYVAYQWKCCPLLLVNLR